jgi:hypothetical protein
MWMPVGALGLLLAISGPSMLIAWLKLRQRNVGPILDANGWSVNALAKINIPFGSALTKVAALPRGARRQLRDPFAQKRRPWGLYLTLLVLLVLAVLWRLGHLDPYLPGKFKSGSVFGGEVPLRQGSGTSGGAAQAARPSCRIVGGWAEFSGRIDMDQNLHVSIPDSERPRCEVTQPWHLPSWRSRPWRLCSPRRASPMIGPRPRTPSA